MRGRRSCVRPNFYTGSSTWGRPRPEFLGLEAWRHIDKLLEREVVPSKTMYTYLPSPVAYTPSGDQGVCPGMQKVFWRQKCPGTRGVRDNRRPGTVLAVPGHLASSQDTYAVLGRCCPKTANCPGTGAGVPGPPSWDTRCPGTPRVPGHFLVLRNAPP